LKYTRIAVVFGTRPEFLKMAPVLLALNGAGQFEVKTIFTGQHEKMMLSLNFFPEFSGFSRELNVMNSGQSLGELQSKLIFEISRALADVKPDLCLVHGDTSSALAAAQAAFYLGIPVGHVEAGLRTHDLTSPFPEEMNRQVIGKLAELHFAPTAKAKDNLLLEGVPANKILVTGNTIVDSLRLAISKLSLESVGGAVEGNLKNFDQRLVQDDLFALVTAHRRENHAHGIREICLGIKAFSREFPHELVAFSMHPNPVLSKIIEKELKSIPSVVLLPALSYENFLYLLGKVRVVLTDSGGVQEEAVSLGKAVLVTRSSTERAEGEATGLLRVIGTEPARVRDELIQIAMRSELSPKEASLNNGPYGDGLASNRIRDAILGLMPPEFSFSGPLAPTSENGK
jgi:UDP-N-acetylglucosamine 2-epimerase (non-hydrolysing)